MDLVVNGQITVGNAKYWRIDNVEEMSGDNYDPVHFLLEPWAVVRDRNAAEAICQALGSVRE